MVPVLYADILKQQGFQLIGQLDYRLHLTVWWNPAVDRRLQVIILSVGDSALIKGDKSYFLKSVSAEGETWARDVGLLHDYLENHFPELRLSFSHFRDVPPDLAEAEVRRRMAVEAPTQSVPTIEQIALLQRQLDAKQRDLETTGNVLEMSASIRDLLTGYLHQQTKAQKAQVEQVKTQLERERQRLSLFEHLQKEYQHKGSAGAYSFTISSNLQVAQDARQFEDALGDAVKELTDLHRYQVMQKLGGGRLNIQVAEADEPGIVWIEQWLGGALSPTQMRRLGKEWNQLKECADDHVIITPDEPIVVDGRVRHAEKHLAARIVSSILQRVDRSDTAGRPAAFNPEQIAPEAMPLRLGHRVDDTGRRIGTAAFPLTQMVHAYISGTTGGGKSYLARVLIEEALQHKNLNILILDPRNQSVGLLVPEDRSHILKLYDEFAMHPRQARGFPCDYFAPASPHAPPLPPHLASLASGRSIVSLKGMNEQQRCAHAARILNAAFEACSDKESEVPRLLILVDEAQLFTRKRVEDEARDAAAQAERAIDRIAREGRKFGIVLTIVTQTIKDFSYELASVRQMTTTKIFLRNSDREIEYAADIIGDGRMLVQLPTGTAIVHNAHWGVMRIRVRPPYSKVFEPADDEIRRVVGHEKDLTKTVSLDAQRLLALILEHGSPPHDPVNMSQAAELAAITSKRRLLELIGELEQAGAIRIRRLRERGTPRVIEPVIKPDCQSQDEGIGSKLCVLPRVGGLPGSDVPIT